jgi:MFS family permease
MFATKSFALALTLGGAAGLVLAGAVPALFTVLHEICGSARRAMAVALLFFFANLFGLGGGPLLTGGISDALSPHYGNEALRYALMAVMLLLLPASWLLYRCGQHLGADREP